MLRMIARVGQEEGQSSEVGEMWMVHRTLHLLLLLGLVH